MSKRELTEQRRRFKEFRLKTRDQRDKEISDILSKYAVKIGGGFFIAGAIAGRLSR